MAARPTPNRALDIHSLDRIDREAFKVIDEIRCESADGRPDGHAFQLPLPKDDLASTRGYEEVPLDNRVNAIERAVTTMARRIDLLLEAGRTARRDAMTPAPQQWRESARHSQSDYVRAHIDRERYDTPLMDGKQLAGDIFTRDCTPKPYMYIDKLEGETLRKKQEYKNMCDPRARDTDIILYQLNHLNDVALDALSVPWAGVRAWSNFVFDSVEKNRFTWADTQDIQNHRFRLSLSQVRSRNETGNSDRNVTATKESICMDFNAGHCPAGAHKKHHTEGMVRLMHWCSYCMAVDGFRADNHGLSTCRKKQRNAIILAANQAPQQLHTSVYQHPNHLNRHKNYNQNVQKTRSVVNLFRVLFLPGTSLFLYM